MSETPRRNWKTKRRPAAIRTNAGVSAPVARGSMSGPILCGFASHALPTEPDPERALRPREADEGRVGAVVEVVDPGPQGPARAPAPGARESEEPIACHGVP